MGVDIFSYNLAYLIFSIKYWSSSLKLQQYTSDKPLISTDCQIKTIFYLAITFISLLTIVFIVFNWIYNAWMATYISYCYALINLTSTFYLALILDAFCRMKKVATTLNTFVDSKNMLFLIASFSAVTVASLLLAI